MAPDNPKDELEYFVSQFFGEERIHFSDVWRTDLIRRLLALDTQVPYQFIDKIHDDKLEELRRSGARWLRAHTSGYSIERIEDIVHDGFLKWLKYFDAEKSEKSDNPEFNYLVCCIESALASDFKTTKLLPPEDRQVHETVLAEKRAAPLRPTVLSLDDVSSQDHARYLSTTSHDYEAEDRVELGGRYYSAETGIEIYKFRLLTGSVEFPTHKRTRALPPVDLTYKPLRSRILDSSNPETANLTSATKFHRARFLNLKRAEKRRWMELALLEMRKSKQKLISFLKTKSLNFLEFNAEEFSRRIPILSAVAVDAEGNLIDTCYKGQIDDPEHEERAWYKHCEFSLFEEVIGRQNINALNGGALFVTLEPCNKRGFYLDGADRKPKIPCAVRCVEAGIKTVYIGALDFNKKVYKKGLAILETGEYSFDLDALDEGSTSLERYFSERYDHVTIGRIKTYTIGKPVTVARFDDDLVEEICEINSVFLQAHERSAFR
jgi:pyrimidine deaminase RibD-like protein